ncbi:MAG TPA: glycosyltransferase family 4 protein [Bryobacteraceae bacterium]|jgi:glycosyltransferase involved in cell wall biosynthesis
MRILHIDTGTAMRGGQAQLMVVARGLRDRGHSQSIACPESSALAKAASEEGFPVVPLDREYWRGSQSIRQFLAKNPHDLSAAHDARAQTVSYLSTVGTPIARAAHRNVAFDPRNGFMHRLKYTRTCHVVIASSQAVMDALVRNGVPPQQIKVVRGGIEFPEQLPDRQSSRSAMRAKWDLDEGDFVIGHLAAFTPEKGQLDALDALAELLPRHLNLRMILAGDGPLRNDPKTIAKARVVGAAAVLPGYIKPDAEFYAGLNLFVANSTSEALGLAPLYAMAHEVPVIASNVGGLPEVVGDGGWLVPPADSHALAKMIQQVMEDPAELAVRGRRAREHAREFSAAITVERTEAAYLDAIAAAS